MVQIAKDKIKIEHINAQSLQGHMEEINLLINDRCINILCISETWLLPSIESKFINIPNFNVFRQDGGRGGGVCMYVEDSFKCSQIHVSVPKQENVDLLWLDIQSNKFPSFIVGTVYRHPHALAESFEYISDVFKEILLRNKPVFVTGDVNDDLFNGNSKLCKVLNVCNLHQLITKPTRITPTSSTLIDIIATNNIHMVLESDVFPCPIADHEQISVTINVRKKKKMPIFKTFRYLKNYSGELLCNKIFFVKYLSSMLS